MANYCTNHQGEVPRYGWSDFGSIWIVPWHFYQKDINIDLLVMTTYSRFIKYCGLYHSMDYRLSIGWKHLISVLLLIDTPTKLWLHPSNYNNIVWRNVMQEKTCYGINNKKENWLIINIHKPWYMALILNNEKKIYRYIINNKTHYVLYYPSDICARKNVSHCILVKYKKQLY